MIDTTTFPAEKFTYTYLAGPVKTVEEIDSGFKEGNCRFALQLYFYRLYNKFFKQDEIYLPGGYKVLGNFIFKEEPIDFDKLKKGDIIYAQNFRNKQGDLLKKDQKYFKTKDEWLYHLHSAIYLGAIDPDSDEKYIWHATSIEGGAALWNLEKFIYHYLPISAKRVL